VKVLAIIPARAGSKEIPGKNTMECGGRPLIGWTVQACDQSQLLDWAVISTDIIDMPSMVPDILEAVMPVNVEPAGDISDDAQIEDRLDSIIQSYDPRIIVLLQPTSPVRTGKQIDEAIQQLERDGADSLLSVVPSHAFTWTMLDGEAIANYGYEHRPPRQHLAQRYEETGSIYVFTREHWDRTHNRLGGRISLYIMPEACRVQVDTIFDHWIAEQILQKQQVLVA
jgi:CMP-N,N'-diacetyllegionaminic acid synthase